MNAILEKLPALVQEELDAANLAFPAFASMHEGYAVLLEEVEEANEELDCMEGAVEKVWHNVKTDNIEIAMLFASYVEDYAIRLAAEAIQVAAMAKKFGSISKGEKA